MGKLKVMNSVEKTFGRGIVMFAFVMLAIPASGFSHEIPKTEETEELLLKESSSSGQTEEESGQRTITY
ncbi:MAG: hypothetical protein F4X92_01675, partial [Gammaproteobacteria bacterium]|nr:hypothetical protein [Gammaproteobacteria bacterium]